MKHLEVRQKYLAARRIFNSFLSVSSGDETLRLMFDILHETLRLILDILHNNPKGTIYIPATNAVASRVGSGFLKSTLYIFKSMAFSKTNIPPSTDKRFSSRL